MHDLFEYLKTLEMSEDQREMISKIKILEPETGDLDVLEMIFQALPQHAEAIALHTAGDVEEILAAERRYYDNLGS